HRLSPDRNPSTPVVEDVDSRPAVAGRVGTVHRDALDFAAEAARHHVAVRLLARHVDPRQEARHPDRPGQRATGVEEPGETLFGRRPRPRGAELDKAAILSGLARRTPMTDREAGKAAPPVP